MKILDSKQRIGRPSFYKATGSITAELDVESKRTRSNQGPTVTVIRAGRERERWAKKGERRGEREGKLG